MLLKVGNREEAAAFGGCSALLGLPGVYWILQRRLQSPLGRQSSEQNEMASNSSLGPARPRPHVKGVLSILALQGL